VADPSAPDAWVTGIMEGREWVYVDGKFMEQDIEHVQKTIRKASQKDVERVAAQLFESFLKKL
jgi:hypothetical protein